jgi:hypothetical protein
MFLGWVRQHRPAMKGSYETHTGISPVDKHSPLITLLDLVSSTIPTIEQLLDFTFLIITAALEL